MFQYAEWKLNGSAVYSSAIQAGKNHYNLFVCVVMTSVQYLL